MIREARVPAGVLVVGLFKAIANGYDFTGRKWILKGSQEVSGHDFSRAVNADQRTGALAPEGRLCSIEPNSGASASPCH